MADNQPTKTTNSDEIDLGQLLKMIGNGFNRIGDAFLRTFLYLKKNVIKLAALVVIGLLISYLLSSLVDKKLKTEVMIMPNFDSKDYVYDVIEEIQSNIRSRDSSFFENFSIDVADLEGFDLEIEPITDPEDAKEDVEQDLMYLELLQGFKEESFAVDIMRRVLTRKNIVAHRITFTYVNAQTGTELSKKILNYINTNEYFQEVKNAFRENAKMRIDQNTVLIGQIDNLISGYSQTMLQNKKESSGSIYLENESALNISSLLTLKNRFVKEIEEKKLELSEQKEVLSILNMGKTQQVRKPLFNNNFVLIPLSLVVLFFIVSFLIYLNKRASRLDVKNN
ncbi:hypothetical protein D1013_01145 [Euzebyella marina]|uniref:Uncharacterized protein n=1 Tax=Euzebyella marina TaxID=1761453 RepID=A0A3G2L1I3_9FLAO|nr:hypothetical protein [Euzebyella marina]AYN66081.1 hypothetical protein D1013_01145 [Euzebyella marina]